MILTNVLTCDIWIAFIDFFIKTTQSFDHAIDFKNCVRVYNDFFLMILMTKFVLIKKRKFSKKIKDFLICCTLIKMFFRLMKVLIIANSSIFKNFEIVVKMNEFMIVDKTNQNTCVKVLKQTEVVKWLTR